jgi:uncharacterized protein
MTAEPAREPFGDPFDHGFWAGARAGELRVQRCGACGHHQHPGRPVCVRCMSDEVAWVAAAGTGTLHSATEVHVQITPQFTPPYVVGLVALDEGPRLLVFAEGGARIGDRVAIGWREREDAPPLPVARPAGDA